MIGAWTDRADRKRLMIAVDVLSAPQHRVTATVDRPKHLLGRIISVAMVLAWSANPIGAIGGGSVIEGVGNARLA